MTRQVELASPGMTLREAAQKMRERDTGMLPVGENDRLAGAVTDRDVVVRCVAEGKDPNSCTIREAMSPGIKYCYEDQDLSEAVRIMGRNAVQRLPVLNRDKRLVGIVSLGEIAERGYTGEAGEALEEISEAPAPRQT